MDVVFYWLKTRLSHAVLWFTVFYPWCLIVLYELQHCLRYHFYVSLADISYCTHDWQ